MWPQLVIWAVTTVVSYLLRPAPPPGPQPGRIEIPTVEEGRKIGALFGGRWIKDPHVYWWGDVRTTPIRVSGGK